MPARLILGIESSCDETSAAVVRDGPGASGNEMEILSNVVASQLIHASYGGVVPELASREHLRAIIPVVREAMHRAGITYADLDAVAVTAGPGLAGALLVGITFAKSLAFGIDKPLIAINHLEGHIHAVLMDAHNLGAPPLSTVERVDSEMWEGQSPLLALVVSGGHTHLYLATRTPHETWAYRNVGKTLDDAAGEAFDKVAKLLGLPYPGGPWIDALAAHGTPDRNLFPFTQIKQKATGNTAPKLARELNAAASARLSVSTEARSMEARSFEARSFEAAALKGRDFSPAIKPPDAIGFSHGGTASSALVERRFDLSFSGIKTAVRRYVELHHMRDPIVAREAALKAANLNTAKPTDPATLAAALQHFDQPTLDLIASFQAGVVKNLARQTFAAAAHFGAKGILVSGGVAANSHLRQVFTIAAAQHKLPVAFPTVALSTDNAAMIAAAAFPKLHARDFAPDTLEPTPQLRLG